MAAGRGSRQAGRRQRRGGGSCVSRARRRQLRGQCVQQKRSTAGYNVLRLSERHPGRPHQEGVHAGDSALHGRPGNIAEDGRATPKPN